MIARQLLHKGSGARLGNRTEVVHHLIPGHADPVVVDDDRLRLTVRFHSNPVVTHTGAQARIADDRKAMLINGVRRIGDELAEKNLPIRVQGVNHEVKQSLRLGLKDHRLGSFGSHEETLFMQVLTRWGLTLCFQVHRVPSGKKNPL